ncbi:MAG: Biotin transporter BioY [Chloroflexi bacterium AL-W]|nr:Biotin transporter BioY [Chloroflexi bacterium AL-N1]NOK65722.1 Biotin transporter BioY [Chloroflexi bacterium AL-N10]NOK74337.1 Biotin transporter BioY [Chloroflexi bacterium AL-N5]NOK80755.1 Biotin transporter BioY [Chloroflexi bacterium AL-W]NOK88595.1 Biotin transporter BioY [Chloroflexi bacterium AL-N15]
MLNSHTTLAQRLLPQTGILQQSQVRNGLLVLAGTMFMALCAQISIPLPFTPVPITMQTFGVLIIGALFGPRLGAITMVVYLLEGLAGLPVFTQGRSAWSPSSIGVPVIIGPTAGYLFSYPIAAALVGTLATRGWDRSVMSAVPAMLLGNLVILACGFIWFAAANYLIGDAVSLWALFQLAILPFLAGDALKIALAALALPGGWALLHSIKKDRE